MASFRLGSERGNQSDAKGFFFGMNWRKVMDGDKKCERNVSVLLCERYPEESP